MTHQGKVTETEKTTNWDIFSHLSILSRAKITISGKIQVFPVPPTRISTTETAKTKNRIKKEAE